MRRMWREFERSETGNFAVAFALASTTLIAAVGFGVDTVRMFEARSSLLNALDAAVTSTARDLTTGKIEPDEARATVEAFLFANLPGRHEGLVTLESLTIDRSAKTVEGAASVNLPIYFPFLHRASHQRLAVESAALYSDRKVEVAMMLDVTGSMGTNNKIGALRDAAKVAVEAFLGKQDPKKPRVRMAIVPYAEAVNVGALATETVFVEKKGGSNLPPPVDAPLPASASGNDCATERKLQDGSADFSSDGPFDVRWRKVAGQDKAYHAKVNRDDRLNVCPKASVVALTASKDDLLRTIGKFRADGVTAGAIAAQWGYYMLSPAWRGAIRNAGMGDGPADFNPKKVVKVAVLMTDGQFNTAFAGVPDSDENPQMKHGDKARRYAESLCNNMKRDGITVFTIGFDLDNPDMSRTEREQAKAVLKNCASTDLPGKHYYEVSNGDELKTTFESIAANVEKVTVTR